MRKFPLLPLIAIGLFGSGCSSSDTRPLPRPSAVDVPRFMGDWYVIAHIPSRPEREAFDAVESYALRSDGRIQTTFTYRKGSFDAPQKSMHPIGRVEKEGNGAIWGMQFIWPIQAEYVIAWLDEGYRQTIVARSKRDYVWYMARTPQVSDRDYQQAVERIAAMGYDTRTLRRVPQSVR
ncbi:lipocalin family protein [Stenotrophomonas maltophilia]|uniref:lipocalin family protein n=1 Tax=Stenotrophomonas TaxID=40323 RepID=UPI0006AA269A|nr:lipocalin family protein [Stenotrophomonas geniculata]ALA86599.1 membrane protein [Stenotrophomonas maltophilia]ALA90555.1 membrane protein [Stenotrophomonas maltophilia]MBH1801452.1 lipocalin family protein [Stenotrophomonas maltophilia]MCI1089677.1 lipocalin family protein [Stenotrophomonas maltophilia]MCI1127414.1 lipocalin family protein [Stenotrophomonas maltophilia]